MSYQLKPFKVLTYDSVWATLQCPRSDCNGCFQVNRGIFRGPVTGGTHKKDIDTRPCPYCFRVSLRPKKAPKRKGGRIGVSS